jgi:putative addiction module component (TIGR02574 family)
MSTNFSEELLKLSIAERIQIVEDLWDSIAQAPQEVPVTNAQTAELDRRLARFAQDSTRHTWEEVKERLTRK